MIADNPMSDDEHKYVYHSQKPRFLARRVYDNPMSSFEIVDEIDSFNEFFKHDLSRVQGLMRRLGDWWVAYEQWLAENEDDE